MFDLVSMKVQSATVLSRPTPLLPPPTRLSARGWPPKPRPPKSVARVPIKFIFVERAGAKPAAEAVAAAVGVLESQIGVQVGRVAKRAREEASTALQAKLEVEAERSEALQAELDELLLSNAAQRRKVEAGELQVAALQAQLSRTSSSAAAKGRRRGN